MIVIGYFHLNLWIEIFDNSGNMMKLVLIWCVYAIGGCSVRLTWDVFVRNLNRHLGTPSHWLPVDSCKEGQKGALTAVCTPTLKSASKKHQKTMHLHIGAPRMAL